MKKILNEELDSIKYLINYNRNKLLTENIDFADSVKFSGAVEEIVKDICNNTPNQCEPCGNMIKKMATGNCRTKDIENCLQCDKFTGSEFIDCNKLQGEIEKKNTDVQKDLRDAKGLGKLTQNATSVSGLLATIALIYDKITSFFKKEERL